MIRRLIVLSLLAAGMSVPAGAVVILESTYRHEGYRAAEALAAQPQFAATISFCVDDGDQCGIASGTWIGNDRRHGYILTAAHNFDESGGAETYLYRARDGSLYEGEQVLVNPDYQPGGEEITEGDDGTGSDIAIVVLSEPVTGLGPPPVLYAGDDEDGETLTFVGYGTRGTGRHGEDENLPAGDVAAAAQGVVEYVEPENNDGRGAPTGNYFEVWLPREDGRVADPFEGDVTRPVSKYAGLLGSGDSGGGAWIKTPSGWALAGVNDNGSGNAQYGDTSGFVRVSGSLAFIGEVFPKVRVTRDRTAGN